MKHRRSIPFKTYLTPEENQIIQTRVEAAGLSRSQYEHLVLTSPFTEQLQQAEVRESDKRDLCLLLGQHYTSPSGHCVPPAPRKREPPSIARRFSGFGFSRGMPLL